MHQAAEAFTFYRKISPDQKAVFLETIADNIESLGDALIHLASEETNLHFGRVVELTKKTIKNYELKIDEDFKKIITTQRTKEFLIWRFFDNPYIKYSFYGYVENNTLLSYIALREENLEPFNYKAMRIIDLYGKQEGICKLLERSMQESVLKNHIYIDYSMFGTIYDKELVSSNYLKLENEDCCILPQVTAPIENRPNNEYLGIISSRFQNDINILTKDNVYFTRMDSDRDRLAKLNQIKSNRQ